MKNKNYISDELNDISPSIARMEKTNAFSLPVSYFDNLSENIIKNIRLGKEPIYYFSTENPFTVPEGYFATLPQNILEKVHSVAKGENEVFEEMEEIAPLLNSISKKPVFEVPEGFFSKVQLPVVEAQTSTPAKVVPFGAARRLMRYAAAAIITALLAVGAYLLMDKDPAGSIQPNNLSATEVKKLSEQEIVDFLKTNSSTEISSAAYSGKKDADLKNSLQEITDTEIQQFLQEYSVPGEI